MNKINNNEDKWEPCRIPHGILKGSELKCIILTICFMLVT